MIYRSPISKLRVAFPPAVFGYITTDKPLINDQGKHITDADNHVVYAKTARPDVKFVNGMFRTDDEDLIAVMKKHPGNVENGGGDFRVQDVPLLNYERALAGEMTFTKPVVMGEHELDKLRLLRGYASFHIPENAQHKAEETFHYLFDAFKVQGMKRVNIKDDGMVRLRANIMLLFEAFVDSDIIERGDIKPKKTA